MTKGYRNTEMSGGPCTLFLSAFKMQECVLFKPPLNLFHMYQCVRLCVLMAVDLLPFGNDETLSTRDTNHTHTFQRFGNCSPSL